MVTNGTVWEFIATETVRAETTVQAELAKHTPSNYLNQSRLPANVISVHT